MACSPEYRHTSATPGAGVAVIADHGDRARVVVVRFAHAPGRGDRFVVEGRVWEIVREGTRLRGPVARPVAGARRPDRAR